MTRRQIRKREKRRKITNENLMKQLEVFYLKSSMCGMLKQFFVRNKISSIAIYGGGANGKEFSRICKMSHIRVVYIIDKFVRGEVDGTPVYQFRFDFLPEVDAVIIVPCHEKEFIKFEIRNYFTDACQLIGLDDCLISMEELQNET